MQEFNFKKEGGKMNKSELAQIPYIEHELRMFKAHRREAILKGLLIGSNLLWATTVIVVATRKKK
jgi:hypothetical protein